MLLCPGAPTLELEAQDIVVIEGEKLHLKVPYKAIPTPTMVWQKDTVECKADDRLSMTLEMNDAHLELIKCTHADAGTYTIVLTNTLGTVTGTANVKVIGRSFSILPVKLAKMIFAKVIRSFLAFWKHHFFSAQPPQVFLVSVRTSVPVTLPRTPAKSPGKCQRMMVEAQLSVIPWRDGRLLRRPTCLSYQERMFSHTQSKISISTVSTSLE